MKDFTNMEEYIKEYKSPIMGKLNCDIEWAMISDIASDVNKHHIYGSSFAPMSRIYTVGITADAKDPLNNQQFPKERFATLETDFWKLDGKLILPEPDGGYIKGNEEIGWVSASLSGTDGVFTDKPVLTIDFKNLAEGDEINLTGLAVTFFQYYENDYPVDFNIQVTRSTGQVLNICGSNSSAMLVAEKNTADIPFTKAIDQTSGNALAFPSGITQITKIVVTINKWNVAGHRARIDEIEFGMKKYYTNATLINVEETRAINAVSTELPISSLMFTILDTEKLFNQDTDDNMTKFLTQLQPIKVNWTQQIRTNNTTESVNIPGGIYYLKEWNDSDSRRDYKLIAEDLVAFTEQPFNKGRFYNEADEKKTAGQLIRDLFEDLFPSETGLSDKLDVSAIKAQPLTADDVQDVVVDGPLPLKLGNDYCTYKDCFMVLAQLVGCVITSDDEGRIVFKKLRADYDGSNITSLPEQYKLPVSVVFDKPPKSNLKSPLKEVKVYYYQYKLDTDPSELYKGDVTFTENEAINFELADGGELSQISFNGTKYDISSLPQDTFEIERFTYFISIKCLMASCIGVKKEITLNGKKLIKAPFHYSKKIDNIVNGEVVTIENPICCTEELAKSIADNFFAETKFRDEFDLEVKRNLLWECGDMLEVEKQVWGSDSKVKVPCRLIENKKSLTKVRQKVKLRKLNEPIQN